MARPLQHDALDLRQEDAAAPAATGPGDYDSPARVLQQELERALSGAGEPRWSARRTLGFVVVTNGAFWVAVVWSLRAALG